MVVTLQKKYMLQILKVAVVAFFLLFASYTHGATIPIQGYAWSSSIGAIHFNGATYGVYKDTITGQLSGYAWSEHLKWITFQPADLTGCPSGSCDPEVNPATGAITGWARVCSAFVDKNTCSGPLEVGSGGWDGWIHLGGVAVDSTPYGGLSTNGCWSGYAWGGTNIGAVKFAGTALDTSEYKVGDILCFNPVNLTSGPVILNSGSLVNGNSVSFSSTVSNTANSPTPIPFSNNFTYQWGSASGAWLPLNTLSEAVLNGLEMRTDISSGIVIDRSGTLYVQHCIDSLGEINELNETVADNCAVQSFNVIEGTISATVTSIDGASTTTISWSSTNALSCTVSSQETANTDSWTALSGSEATTPLYENTTYILVCDGLLIASTPITVTIVPNLTVDVPVIEKGSIATLSWDTNNGDETLCSLTGGDINFSSLPTTGIGGPMTGSVQVTVTGQTEYTLTCPNPIGSPFIDRVTVELLPKQFET